MEDYIPVLPFKNYKWLFASKAPTEALGDPAILLGVVTRLAKIADGKTKYSSAAYANAVRGLQKDIETTVNLGRTGERNLIRNSGQYWKAFGLIPADRKQPGIIRLTDLARSLADGRVSQSDFAALMILTRKLPNPLYKGQAAEWENHDLSIHPFKLILQVIRDLNNHDQGWLTNNELYHVVVPMAGDKQKVERISEYVRKYREDPHIADGWPMAEKRANDKRFTCEYLRFLANFGYLEKEKCGEQLTLFQEEQLDETDKGRRDIRRYMYIKDLDYQIQELLDGVWSENSAELLKMIRQSDISSSVALSSTMRQGARPGQQRFRHNLLEQIPQCPITGVTVPEVLQAAHIKPHAFGGPEQPDNGLPLRADIHCLFDAGLLSLCPISSSDQQFDRACSIELRGNEVESNYRDLVGKIIRLPSVTNMEYVRWRYDNYLLGA